MFRHGLHAMGGIHKAERPSKSQPAKQCGFTPAKPSRMFSIRRRVRLARNLLRQRDRQCGSKAAATVAADRAKLRQMPWPADISFFSRNGESNDGFRNAGPYCAACVCNLAG